MQENPAIEIKEFNGVDCIYFTFNGKLSENDATGAISRWKDYFVKSNTVYTHVWNCVNMTGYEPMARISWQKAIKELKNNIGKIWLISDSSIIIAGAKILSLFTKMDINAVKSESDIKD